MPRSPKEGDVILFDVITDAEGRKRAACATIEGLEKVAQPGVGQFELLPLREQKRSVRLNTTRLDGAPARIITERKNTPFFTWFKTLLFGLVLVFGVYFTQNTFVRSPPPLLVKNETHPVEREYVPVAQEYERAEQQAAPVMRESVPVQKAEKPKKSHFKCEGKTYCSQMSSCDEARFYLNNCPGTKMDGDNDRIPCEEQWCG
ncbi:MAG: hypothetical protein RL497_2191 [Pseudomonadota bacterium]